MAHLSFAELLQRQVPLSAGEAVALTLAAAAAADSHGSETQRVAVPDIEQLLLSSTGHVSFGPGPFPPHDDPAAALVFVLTRLLGIDEQRGDSSGRIPGGLLIVLARMRRQIDVEQKRGRFVQEMLQYFRGMGNEHCKIRFVVPDRRAEGDSANSQQNRLFGRRQGSGMPHGAADV